MDSEAKAIAFSSKFHLEKMHFELIIFRNMDERDKRNGRGK